MGTSAGLVHYLPEKDVPNLIPPLLSLSQSSYQVKFQTFGN